MEIGLFQLENLFANPNRFSFIDLRAERTKVHPDLDRLLDQAVAVVEPNTDKDFPIVLVCEKGERSGKLAEQLEAKGFTNVYVVTGGVEGLLLEL